MDKCQAVNQSNASNLANGYYCNANMHILDSMRKQERKG